MNYNEATGLAQALFHEAGDALFLFDPDTDTLLDVNPMAERLTGLPRHELLRMPATYWFRFGGQGGLQRLRKAASKTGAFHSQEGFFLRTRQDRVWIPVNLTTTRLHVQPKTLALITARDIREQREALVQLQAAEAELRRVIVAVADCLWSAVIAGPNQWAYRYLSPVVQKITGQPPDHFLAGIERWRDIVHPEDRPRWDQALARLRAGESNKEEYRILRPDQAIRWVRESVTVSRTGAGPALRLDGVLADITERKRREEQLRESEQRFRAIIENSSDGICLVSPDGIILYASPSTTRMLGYPLDDFVGRDAFERIHPDDLPLTRALFARLLEQPRGTASAQYRYRHLDGSWRWLEGVASNLLAGSRVQAVIVNFRDITERKLAVRRESELRVAGQIQQRLFPAAMPQLAGLDIGGISYPADDTGGDYFDFLKLPDQRIGLVVGDVSGHGYGAALLMASTRAYLRAFAQTHTDIGQILTLTNRVVTADTGDHFVTVVLATVDTAARTLVYASAGHAEGYILDAAGRVKTKLDSTGFPLGILAKSDYSSSSSTALEPGDLVLLLTDGIVEAHNSDLVDFGPDRALDTVRSCRREPARQIAEHLCAAVRSFVQPLPQDDDMTAVVLKVGPPP
jgi:PAS domain S-box-containing protein